MAVRLTCYKSSEVGYLMQTRGGREGCLEKEMGYEEVQGYGILAK